MTEKSAVYFQRSKAVHEEFKLIEAATEREVVAGKLQKVIRNVKEKRVEMVDEVILETFQLLNELREVTMRLIKAIKAWQDSFTRPVRPTIYNCDYIIDRMIKQVDFVNGSKVRKIFNFQFLRGNPLLLPFPNLKGGDPIKVHSNLAKEIRAFANPDEERIIECYQFFVNCLPPEVFSDTLVSMQKWLIEPWIPRVFATNNTTVPCFPSTKQLTQMALQKEYGNRPPAIINNTANQTPTTRERRNSNASSVSKASSQSSKKDAPQVFTTPLATRRRVGAQPIAETSMAGKGKEPVMNTNSSSPTDDKATSPSKDNSPLKANTMNTPNVVNPRIQIRRNMMLQREQNQLRAAVTGDSDLLSVGSDASNNGPVDAEKLKISDAQLAQMQQLDLYYKELEGMFMPKFGRRAVQTLVAGGERQDTDVREGDQEEFQYRTKRAFSMFTSKAFEKRLDDAEQAIRTEDFIRTDGKLIQKRNRIIEQRGKNDGDYRAAGNGRLQPSSSSKSLGSIPEQASTTGRRGRTRSNGGDGADSVLLEDENEDDDDDDEDDDDNEDEDEDDDEEGDDRGKLSRNSSLMKHQRSRRGSSVSFALKVESFDRVNALRPPPIQIGGRPRADSNNSSSSLPLSSQKRPPSPTPIVMSIPRSTSPKSSHGTSNRTRANSNGESSTGSGNNHVRPLRPRLGEKQDSATSLSSTGGAHHGAVSRSSSGSSLVHGNRRPRSASHENNNSPSSPTNNRSSKTKYTRTTETTSPESSKSPIQLSTASMRHWFVENAKREAAIQKEKMLSGKMG